MPLRIKRWVGADTGWQTLCCFVSVPALLWSVWVLATVPQSRFVAAHGFHMMSSVASGWVWVVVAGLSVGLQLSGLWTGPRLPVILGAWLAFIIWSGIAISFWANELSVTGKGMYTLCAIWAAVGVYRAAIARKVLAWEASH
jgi:hypothetical protein